MVPLTEQPGKFLFSIVLDVELVWSIEMECYVKSHSFTFRGVFALIDEACILW